MDSFYFYYYYYFFKYLFFFLIKSLQVHLGAELSITSELW